MSFAASFRFQLSAQFHKGNRPVFPHKREQRSLMHYFPAQFGELKLSGCLRTAKPF
jgi:hypothetical protein